MDASGERAALHTNSSESLFFYENMQGNAPHGKGPVTDLSNGGIANSTTIKDEVPCGTYIEVRAFYVSEASGNISNGEIKYRFMLGKDADKNCDAERNHHYKVTLKFNGNANDYSCTWTTRKSLTHGMCRSRGMSPISITTSPPYRSNTLPPKAWRWSISRQRL